VSEERYRVVLDPAYAAALGQALYCFARCEWNAVYCIQKHQPGYVTNAFRPTQSTMAGTVADKLRSISNRLPDVPEKLEWQQASEIFFSLVKTERNRLVHAKPGTNPAGDQRLFYFGYEWTIERVQEVADKFTSCGIILNDLFHRP
jgi:hypothetical protein